MGRDHGIRAILFGFAAMHRHDHMPNALFLQDALHALDGIAFAIEQMLDAAQQLHIIGTIIAASAAAFHGFDLREAGFPKAQDMLRQVQFLCNFADGTKGVRTLVQDIHP